jgi:hypothetical protein
MLSLVKDITKDDANAILKKLPLIENKIDGFVFVETSEKFRFI